jgi:hypothetical protein
MKPLSWAQVDWAQPWWSGWHTRAQTVWQRWQSGDEALSEVLNQLMPEAPVRFVSQAELPEGLAYEQFIFENQRVPTRENLHDLFNACCWGRFPRSKRRLNALQGEVIAREGIQSTRGSLRDALTLFDENALLLLAPAASWEVLRQHDWSGLFVQQREAWGPAGSIRAVVFGHALLEKLCQPYRSITAHAYWVPVHEACNPKGVGLSPADFLDDACLDEWLSQRLNAEQLARKPFSPLPVMGIPGWCAGNHLTDFYSDVQVFRPRPERSR